LVGPVSAPIPEVDHVDVARERLARSALARLEPEYLGEGERLNPAVSSSFGDVCCSLELSGGFDRVRRL
jgi:hypothetical protein